jgi:hypothetical protein
MRAGTTSKTVISTRPDTTICGNLIRSLLERIITNPAPQIQTKSSVGKASGSDASDYQAELLTILEARVVQDDGNRDADIESLLFEDANDAAVLIASPGAKEQTFLDIRPNEAQESEDRILQTLFASLGIPFRPLISRQAIDMQLQVS